MYGSTMAVMTLIVITFRVVVLNVAFIRVLTVTGTIIMIIARLSIWSVRPIRISIRDRRLVIHHHSYSYDSYCYGACRCYYHHYNKYRP